MSASDCIPFKRQKLFRGLLVLGILIAILMACLYLAQQEPVYQGRPISYWLHLLPITQVSPNGRVSLGTEAKAGGRKYGGAQGEPSPLLAIRKIGTNGLPFLFYKLAGHETRFQRWMEHSAAKCGLKRSLFENVEMERAQAVTALIALKPLPPEYTAKLRKLSAHKDTGIATTAQWLLTNSWNFSSPNSRQSTSSTGSNRDLSQ